MNLVTENKEQAIIPHDSLLDSKVADSMKEIIQEMKETNEVYIPELNNGEKLTNLANDPLHFQAFQMIIDQVREKMKKNKMKLQKDDFVKKNKFLTKYWNQYENEKRQKRHASYNTNLQTAQHKKEELLKFKREKKEMMLKFKKKLKEEEKQKRKTNNLIHAWILLIKQQQMVTAANHLYQERLYLEKVNNRKCFIGLRLMFITQIYMKRLGNTLEIRNSRLNKL